MVSIAWVVIVGFNKILTWEQFLILAVVPLAVYWGYSFITSAPTEV